MLVVTEEDVKRMLPMQEAIKYVRKAFQALASNEAQNQPRRRLILPTGSILHSMAGSYGRYFGTKIYSTHPRHGANFFFHLFDAETGKPLAQFEANFLGQIRTGAATGVATERLAKPDATSLSVFGGGFQALSQVEAVLAVRPIQVVHIWSRRQSSRQDFGEDIAGRFGVVVNVCKSPEEAVAEGEIIITATSSSEPVFNSLPANSPVLINAVGSNWANRREIPDEVVQSASRLVADDVIAARIEAGDFIMSLDDQDWMRVENLADVVAGPETEAAPGVTIFKSVGLGVEDVAAAAAIYEQAIPGR
jgi:ornithine cyclodeaminase/alanine dehydrogenase-like protein (mu-crystallin family)